MQKIEIRTRRMTLHPMTDAEIENLIACTDSDELHTAYGEMLDGCRRDPENRIWYAPWAMTLKDSPTYIGDLGFKGPVKNHAVEIGYGILPEYEGQGYTTEAVQAMTQWAFQRKDVVFAEAETDPENKASQRVLERPRFVREAPLTSWTPIYMLFGITIGMSIGQMLGQMVWGMAPGISLGALAGALLDNSEKKKREALRQQRRSRD
ncbi:MAG: GNAT family N-acetyltransferase [Clostridia bacterium]|nr:GNAT family N-acetyltransferase [Clostridia bacterium]